MGEPKSFLVPSSTQMPRMRWTGDLIPIVFHLVLASFLLSVAHYHRSHRVT